MNIKVYFVLILILLFIINCGQNNNGNKNLNKIELTFFHGFTDYKGTSRVSIFENCIRPFLEKNPQIKINCKSYGSQDFAMTKILASIADQKQPNMIWLAPVYSGELVETGEVVDLEDRITSDPEVDEHDIYPALWELSRYKGRRYSVPFDANNLAVFYNKRHFKEAGIKAIPKTWDEFADVAKKLTIDSNNDGVIERYGFELPAGIHEWVVWIWQTYLWQAGGRFIDQKSGKLLFNETPGVRALNYWIDLLYIRQAAKLAETDVSGSSENFVSGKASMYINGPWELSNMINNKSLDFGVFFLPKLIRYATNVGGENLFIFQDAPEKVEACWRFAKFVLSSEFQSEWSMQNGYLPVTKKAGSNERFQRYLESNEHIPVFINQMNYGFARPNIPEYSSISAELGQEIEKAVYRKKTAKQALDAAAKAVSLLNKY